jgi:hypothetical protein
MSSNSESGSDSIPPPGPSSSAVTFASAADLQEYVNQQHRVLRQQELFKSLDDNSSHRIAGGRRAQTSAFKLTGAYVGCGFSAIEVPPMSFLQRGMTREEQLVTSHFRCFE